MTKQNFKKIPKFKNYQEEAQFWDTHDISDYWEQGKSVKIKTSFPLSTRLELRIDGESAKKLADEARRKGLGPSTLARMWIKERLTNI